MSHVLAWGIYDVFRNNRKFPIKIFLSLIKGRNDRLCFPEIVRGLECVLWVKASVLLCRSLARAVDSRAFYSSAGTGGSARTHGGSVRQRPGSAAKDRRASPWDPGRRAFRARLADPRGHLSHLDPVKHLNPFLARVPPAGPVPALVSREPY